MSDYSEMKVSVVVCAFLFALELAFLIFGLQAGNLALAIGSIVILGFIFMLLFSVSVSVTRDQVSVVYGIGLLRRTVLLQEIQRMEIVPNSSLLSIYDFRREHVLRLFLRSGGRMTVPVGDPKRMMEIISAYNRR